MRAKSRLRRRLWAFLAVALLSLLAAPPASLSARGRAGPTCAACTSPTRCEQVNQSGSTGCSVKAVEGCEEELGLCIIAMNRPEEPGPAGRLRLRTDAGVLAMVPVGEGRYAAWSCDGELIRLVERRPDGTIAELDAAAFRGRYGTPVRG